MKYYSPEHPDYDRWLCSSRCREEPTSQLLHGLVSREVRMEMHRRWRAERCNPVVTYTDDLDRMLAGIMADQIAGRIDSGGHER